MLYHREILFQNQIFIVAKIFCNWHPYQHLLSVLYIKMFVIAFCITVWRGSATKIFIIIAIIIIIEIFILPWKHEKIKNNLKI